MTTDQKQINSLAEKLFQAETTGVACAPIRDEIGTTDLDAAYAVQQVNVARAIKAGRRPVGRKIGLTSVAVQKQLGVDQPDYGYIFADMIVGDGEEISLNRVLQPKVEAEVALVLEHDLAMECPTVADVIRATAYALPAIEVVGSRVENWDITIMDTIADNASSGLVVLGGDAEKA